MLMIFYFSGRIDDIKAIKGELSKHFKIKDLEKAKWILQMKIERMNIVISCLNHDQEEARVKLVKKIELYNK